MGAWGFVFLAYGIVSAALVLYWLLLKRRLHKAEMELAQLRAQEGTEKNEKR